MKKLINIPTIVVEIYYEPQESIAAAYKGYSLPEGPLMPSDKGTLITSEMKDMYYSFIESVEDLLTEYYGLQIVYSNRSKNYSQYYSLIATDDEGNAILKFRLGLRISTHDAHRTKGQQYNKKQEMQSPAMLALGPKATKLKPMFRNITVNDEAFDTYEDAFIKVDSIIESTVATMKR